MAEIRSITNPVINKISKAEYDAKVAAGIITETMIADQVWINQNVTIADQENLRNLKAVATSGSYNDLTDKPTIPTKTSEITNDSGFITSASLPTKTSDLTNDSGFITANDIPEVTETDPTVPAWAKAASKPSYTYDEITSKPTFATVATSGSYNDLADKPTIPSVDGLASETYVQNAVADKATTTYVDTKVANLVGSAPETLNTLEEVATAINNNATVVEALNSSIGNKANASDVTALTTRVGTAETNITALQSGKADKTELFSGSYNDLTDKPTLSTCTLKIWG